MLKDTQHGSGRRCMKLYVDFASRPRRTRKMPAPVLPPWAGSAEWHAPARRADCREYSLAWRPWCWHRKMASVKKRGLWPRKMDPARPTIAMEKGQAPICCTYGYSTIRAWLDEKVTSPAAGAARSRSRNSHLRIDYCFCFTVSAQGDVG